MINHSIFGLNSSFYYFGLEHLIINMCQYIKEGIERKEKICVYTDLKLYKKLLKCVDTKNNCVEYVDMTQVINEYPKLKVNNIRREVLKYIDKINKEGYVGVRFIIQVDYAIYNTSQNNFLNFNRNILNIILEMSASCMCIYNFEDYLKNKRFINEKVIKESYKIHNYRLYNRKLVSVK
ncbi:hypothetical protein D9O40_19305 [Clostridium autoethanogenum]|uniref:MEDS domain-containing protein n=1 Tax=Clostridium autoethanogenum TaxID=84023 RepID=A0A3M0S2Y0_9CLOT|nr:MEDS domain-containing protein [Clostridium autoethanogenum]RMC92848.1 hypothetical protein D9O40_19305 [Clostridium autoethanogenum]